MDQFKQPHRLFAVLPSYNEQANIESLIETWLSLSGELAARGYTLIVCPIDDGSRDQTRAIIERMAAADARIGFAWRLNTTSTNFPDCKLSRANSASRSSPSKQANDF